MNFSARQRERNQPSYLPHTQSFSHRQQSTLELIAGRSLLIIFLSRAMRRYNLESKEYERYTTPAMLFGARKR